MLFLETHSGTGLSEFTEEIVSRMCHSIRTWENVRQRLMVYIGKKIGPSQIPYSHLLARRPLGPVKVSASYVF